MRTTTRPTKEDLQGAEEGVDLEEKQRKLARVKTRRSELPSVTSQSHSQDCAMAPESELVH